MRYETEEASNVFARAPEDDRRKLRKRYAHPDRGAHHFFRHAHADMQQRFVELADVDEMPRVFLHGNPHLVNYAKNARGAAMVDFDRSRFGPFGYDISRFLISLALRRGDDDDAGLLHPAVLDSFRRGYLLGASAPARGFEEMRLLRAKEPKDWQKKLWRYLEKGRKWGGRLYEHAIDANDPRLRAMLASYFEGRDETDLLDRLAIDAAAAVPGTMGKVHTLVLLVPKHESELGMRLLDFKETYDEPDDDHFESPWAHEGQRMVDAGNLHAPGWEFDPGWASHDGVQYWVRGIPRQNEKLKHRLDAVEQIDLAFSVASQLGRAHGLSVMGASTAAMLDCFEHLFVHLVEVAREMHAELEEAHHTYLEALDEWPV